jgi:hypothetical protein
MVFASITGIAVVLAAQNDTDPRKNKSYTLEAQFFGGHKETPILARLDYFNATGLQFDLERDPIFLIDSTVRILMICIRVIKLANY